MFNTIIRKVIGTKNDRELKRLGMTLLEVNDFEPRMMALSDAELTAKTSYFKERIKNGAELEDIIAEAFAAAREASRRTLLMRP
ncbi:MAG: hypothetical protein COX51_00700, partial [Syntrophobacteraceae bacterium CG23_combo_of_CG06-09_8_20_14_all_50_8]